MNELPKEITYGDKYRPAMEITDQAKADEYFELCVRHMMSFGHDRTEAEQIERTNLGYIAGYFDIEVQRRVQELYHCVHPIFGGVP